MKIINSSNFIRSFHYLDMKVIAKEVQTAVKRGKVSTRYSVSEQKHYNE